MGWWRFTRLALEALTTPADAAGCDRAMEQLARESRLGGALHRVSWMIREAWLSSHARQVAASMTVRFAPFRVRGWMAVVAGVTALALNAAKPAPAGPLSWLLPFGVIVAGVLVMLMAAPLARAVSDRNS